MLSAQKVPNDFIVALKPALAIFKSRYKPSLFGVPSFSRESLYQICENYYKEVSHEGISSEEVSLYGTKILDDERFSRFPPNTREFAVHIKRMTNRNSPDSSGLDESLIKLFEWLGRRYPGLWHSSENRSDVISDWESFLSQVNCDDYDVEAVINNIRGSSEYSTYPPSSAAIERLLRISSLGSSIPSASEAFLAISRGGPIENLPLIVRYARRIFGSYALRTRTDQSVRRDFVSLYNSVVDDYLAGSIDLEKEFEQTSNKAPATPVEEPKMKKSDLAKLISGM